MCFGASKVRLGIQQARPAADRFWPKVDVRGVDECWEWAGARKENGYGKFIGLGESYAHRVAYRLHHGDIAAGLYVCHTCDNPPCVNPAHLFLGTSRDNQLDCESKGRRKPRVGTETKASRLTDAQVREARLVVDGEISALARSFGVHPSTLLAIRHGRTWRHVA